MTAPGIVGNVEAAVVVIIENNGTEMEEVVVEVVDEREADSIEDAHERKQLCKHVFTI